MAVYRTIHISFWTDTKVVDDFTPEDKYFYLCRINKKLSDENSIKFIRLFTNSLAASFDHLMTFLAKDEKEYIEIHSLIELEIGRAHV